jgi:hypothetical protein
VDPAHFGNMDEVPVSFDLPGSRTVHLKGAKELSVATTGHEKSNFTVVLSVTSDGGKLHSFACDSDEDFVGFE